MVHAHLNVTAVEGDNNTPIAGIGPPPNLGNLMASFQAALDQAVPSMTQTPAGYYGQQLTNQMDAIANQAPPGAPANPQGAFANAAWATTSLSTMFLTSYLALPTIAGSQYPYWEAVELVHDQFIRIVGRVSSRERLGFHLKDWLRTELTFFTPFRIPDVEALGFPGTGLQWLRFFRWAVSNHTVAPAAVAAPVNLFGEEDTTAASPDNDIDLAATICGIRYAQAGQNITTATARCTLAHDIRRTFTGTADTDGAHMVYHHGVLDVQSVPGARFIALDEWNTLATAEKRVSAYPLYVYEPLISVPLLKHEQHFYPDLRSDQTVTGLWKVIFADNPQDPEAALEAVYTNELYGSVDSDKIIQIRNNVGDPPGVNPAPNPLHKTTYYIKCADNEVDFKLTNPTPFHPCRALYYLGMRAGGPRPDHVVHLFDQTGQVERRTVDRSAVGTYGSIYKLGACFGLDHAEESVLGCPLAIQIIEVDQTPGVPPNRMYIARGAPLMIQPEVAAGVTTLNPRQGLPTVNELSNALARKGRHNEIGIALQALQNGKQGDLILYDGV